MINGLIAITQRGSKPLLYFVESGVHAVRALDLNGENVALSGGRYDLRPVVDSKQKRANRILVYGTCAPGTWTEANLKVYLDTAGDPERRGRTMSFSVRGPFSRAQNILFYQELPPSAATGREIAPSIQDLAGIDIEIDQSDIEMTERG